LDTGPDSFICWLAHPALTAQDSNTIAISLTERGFFIAGTPVDVIAGIYWRFFYRS
jgi:hypothetical protein